MPRAYGDRKDHVISALAARLAMLDRRIDAESHAELAKLARGLFKAQALFGARLDAVLGDLSEALVA